MELSKTTEDEWNLKKIKTLRVLEFTNFYSLKLVFEPVFLAIPGAALSVHVTCLYCGCWNKSYVFRQRTRGTYAFTHAGNFSSSSYIHTYPSKLKIQPRDSKSSLEAQNPALRHEIQLRGSKSSFKAQNPASRLKLQRQSPKSSLFSSSPSLKAQIPVLRFKSQPRAFNWA